jgi:hypothetical protein
MATYLIRHRWTRRALAAIEAPTYARALEWAARCGMSLIDADLSGTVLRGAFLAGADLRGAGLSGADLSGCFLRGADLRGADLRGARLAHAFLAGADLREADLREADLSRADLRGTNLLGADLRGTILTGARLGDAVYDWRWSAIPAELLRQQNGASAEGSRLVVVMAFHDDQSPWNWLKLLSGHDCGADWALGILADSIRDGDNAPDLLRCLTSDARNGRDDNVEACKNPAQHLDDHVAPKCNPAAGLDLHHATSADPESAPRMMWTCRQARGSGATRVTPTPHHSAG